MTSSTKSCPSLSTSSKQMIPTPPNSPFLMVVEAVTVRVDGRRRARRRLVRQTVFVIVQVIEAGHAHVRVLGRAEPVPDVGAVGPLHLVGEAVAVPVLPG